LFSLNDLWNDSSVTNISSFCVFFAITTGYGFNPGSALLLGVKDSGLIASVAAVNTTLAAGCGAISALFSNLYLEERKTGDYSFNLTMAMNGLLGGLVAITAGCGTVEPWAACLIGVVAGWVYLGGSALLLRLKIDDAVDAIPVHLFNGAWGLISTGLFSSPGRLLEAFGTEESVGWFYSVGSGSMDFQLLCNQCVALLFLIGWPIVTMTPFFIWLNYMGWLRADSLEELVGLDMSYHGGADPHDVDGNDDDIDEEDMKAFEKRRFIQRGTGDDGDLDDDE
jgi:Amt family ammonium transporter